MRSPDLKSRHRYGPVPTGRKFAGASRERLPRYGSNTWRGMIMLTPQKAAIQNGVGALKVSLTVWVSTASARSIAWSPTTPGDPVAGSITYCQLKTTSSAVNGLPSCQVTPRLSRHVTDRPSRASRSEEHTSELQSPCNLVCRLLLEKKKLLNLLWPRLNTG